MAKILMMHTYYPVPDFPDFIGGAEFSQTVIARGLKEKFGHEVSVLRGLPPRVKPASWIVDGIEVFGLPLRRPYWLLDGRKRSSFEKSIWHMIDDIAGPPKDTEALLDRLKPDLIQLGNIVGLGSGLIPVARKLGISTFQILRDYYFICPRMTRFKFEATCKNICAECRIATIIRRRRFREIDQTVAVSNSMANCIGALTGTSGIGTIYNGIAPTLGKILSRREISVNGRPLQLGYIGRLSPEKGIELLIKALPPDVNLTIAGIGSDSYTSKLRSLSGPNITFLGLIDGPFSLLAQIDILVVPSCWDEPFGRVSIEAQMVGVPVIVSDRGGLPETVWDGVTGRVVSPTVLELNDAIISFRDMPELITRYSTAARIWAESFTQDHMLIKINDHIEAMIA